MTTPTRVQPTPRSLEQGVTFASIAVGCERDNGTSSNAVSLGSGAGGSHGHVILGARARWLPGGSRLRLSVIQSPVPKKGRGWRSDAACTGTSWKPDLGFLDSRSCGWTRQHAKTEANARGDTHSKFVPRADHVKRFHAGCAAQHARPRRQPVFSFSERY